MIVEDMSRLRHLDLHANMIEYLPDGDYLANLTHLDLSNTSMDDVPEVLSEITGLRHLDLSGTGILDLPQGKYESSLTWLSLATTNLEEVPVSVEHLKRLRHLDLSETDIVSLPSGTYLAGLTTLNLYNTRMMTHMPTAVSCAREVEELHLTIAGPRLDLAAIRVMKALPKLSRLHLMIAHEDGQKAGEHDLVGRLFAMHMLAALERSFFTAASEVDKKLDKNQNM